ncbi:DUF4286 family protein [Chryseobacterium oryzae]|uniref:DUF4286 family protein n=1 Tax=Chryseobacterium oryzae TaxID=2929799 RepID=A0ABY4BKU2_9FLAO|nr:DUF4286 family protein [Chryseobacterium oryzae]UOE39374.1 DUF4286 family protein [Chryseobacterium oryzae]
MSVLSITFHCIKTNITAWEEFVNESLILMTENLMDVDQYILSEVQSDYIDEGKNYNLLLLFSDDEKREEFNKSELLNIIEIIENKFADQIMIFNTSLNPITKRI